MEAARLRRSAYKSGRREIIGAEKRDLNPFGRKTRKPPKKRGSDLISRTPFKGNFRWRVR